MQKSKWEQILENQQERYIIWGKNCIGECLSKVLREHNKSILYFWDTYKTGMVNQVQITIPPDSFAKFEKNLKSCCVILTFESDENNEKFTRMLKDNGFTNIIDGRILIDEICDAKIKEDRKEYEKANKRTSLKIKRENDFIFKDEWLKSAGVPVSDEYFQQDLWAAQKVFENNPEMHYDIGSSISGFIAHILSFKTRVTLIDIRPFDKGNLENLTFVQEDATSLHGIEEESINSLSALCSLEHFGLGRYGDPIDPDADLKVFANINRVTASGANVYIAVPIGHERLHFNAHRVYDPMTVINAFKEMSLIEFSCTSPKGVLSNITPESDSGIINGYARGTNGYTTGLFHFRKKR